MRAQLGAALVLAMAVPVGASAAPPSIVFAADRRPALSGDVYRVTLDGRRTNLTRSGANDFAAVAAPRGDAVTFLTAPPGSWFESRGHVSVVQSGRTHRVSAGLLLSEPVWAPDGKRLAARNDNVVYVLQPGRAPRRVSPRYRRDVGVSGVEWSPRGSLLTWEAFAEPSGPPYVEAVTSTGRRAWRIRAETAVGWSRAGVFAAVVSPAKIALYDERGRLLRSFLGRGATWSSDRTRLYVYRRGGVEVRTEHGQLVRGAKQRAWPSRALAVSADGRLLVVYRRVRASFELLLERRPRGTTTGLGRIHGCHDDGALVPAVDDVQFTAASRAVVYRTRCDEPVSRLYAIEPNATGLRRLRMPGVWPYRFSPAFAPAGDRIVFAAAPAVGLSCKGCPSAIWIAAADGSRPTALTRPRFCTFDRHPVWSTDGRTVFFTRSSCYHADRGYAVAAVGGKPRRPRRPLQRVRPRVRLPLVGVRSVDASRDGTRLVVVGRSPGAAVPDVYVVDADGQNLRRLTQNVNASSATWR